MEINELSIEEKIGQMIITGIEGNSITKRTEKLILKYKKSLLIKHSICSD